MKKLLIFIIIIAGVMTYLNKQNELALPEFSDELNEIICIEEHII